MVLLEGGGICNGFFDLVFLKGGHFPKSLRNIPDWLQRGLPYMYGLEAPVKAKGYRLANSVHKRFSIRCLPPAGGRQKTGESRNLASEGRRS